MANEKYAWAFYGKSDYHPVSKEDEKKFKYKLDSGNNDYRVQEPPEYKKPPLQQLKNAFYVKKKRQQVHPLKNKVINQ